MVRHVGWYRVVYTSVYSSRGREGPGWKLGGLLLGPRSLTLAFRLDRCYDIGTGLYYLDTGLSRVYPGIRARGIVRGAGSTVVTVKFG